jgi:DNA-binding GntR family transcriptional regulator
MDDLADYKNYLADGELPLYIQVAYVLEHYLSSGYLEQGSRFLTEKQISAQLEVSRPTVNRAIGILIKNGILERVRGKGTIVCRSDKVQLVMMSELLSYGEMLKRLGKRYHTALIDRRIVTPPRAMAATLNISENEKTVFLKRLRYVEDEPTMIVDSYHPHGLLAGLMTLDASVFEYKDLYNILDEYFNTKVLTAERQVMASRMSLIDAQLFKTDLWTPCLTLLGISYAADKIPVEVFKVVLKGNTCVLKSYLKRKFEEGEHEFDPKVLSYIAGR